jgi:hypothetical protein
MRSRKNLTSWLALILCLSTLAATAAWAEDAKPRRDENCTSQCDSDSDKCMAAAGRDKDKQKTCDSQYEDCLMKCN